MDGGKRALVLESDFETRHRQVGHLLKQYGNAVAREKLRSAEVQDLKTQNVDLKGKLESLRRPQAPAQANVEVEEKTRAPSASPSTSSTPARVAATQMKTNTQYRKLLSEKMRLSVALADQTEKNAELRERLVEAERKYQEALGQVSQLRITAEEKREATAKELEGIKKKSRRKSTVQLLKSFAKSEKLKRFQEKILKLEAEVTKKDGHLRESQLSLAWTEEELNVLKKSIEALETRLRDSSEKLKIAENGRVKGLSEISCLKGKLRESKGNLSKERGARARLQKKEASRRIFTALTRRMDAARSRAITCWAVGVRAAVETSKLHAVAEKREQELRAMIEENNVKWVRKMDEIKRESVARTERVKAMEERQQILLRQLETEREKEKGLEKELAEEREKEAGLEKELQKERAREAGLEEKQKHLTRIKDKLEKEVEDYKAKEKEHLEEARAEEERIEKLTTALHKERLRTRANSALAKITKQRLQSNEKKLEGVRRTSLAAVNNALSREVEKSSMLELEVAALRKRLEDLTGQPRRDIFTRADELEDFVTDIGQKGCILQELFAAKEKEYFFQARAFDLLAERTPLASETGKIKIQTAQQVQVDLVERTRHLVILHKFGNTWRALWERAQYYFRVWKGIKARRPSYAIVQKMQAAAGRAFGGSRPYLTHENCIEALDVARRKRKQAMHIFSYFTVRQEYYVKLGIAMRRWIRGVAESKADYERRALIASRSKRRTIELNDACVDVVEFFRIAFYKYKALEFVIDTLWYRSQGAAVKALKIWRRVCLNYGSDDDGVADTGHEDHQEIDTMFERSLYKEVYESLGFVGEASADSRDDGSTGLVFKSIDGDAVPPLPSTPPSMASSMLSLMEREEEAFELEGEDLGAEDRPPETETLHKIREGTDEEHSQNAQGRQGGIADVGEAREFGNVVNEVNMGYNIEESLLRILIRVFEEADRDGDGQVSDKEFLRYITKNSVLRNISKTFPQVQPAIKPAKWKNTFKIMDEDGHGTITKAEFLSFFSK